MMRHFESLSTGQRYHRFRPRVHDMVVQSIKQLLPTDILLEKAVDMGCGTGHSTQPLMAIAREVVGIDISEGMLAIARTHYPEVSFIHAPAEETGLPDHAVDLICCSMAFHWFDPSRFMEEMARISNRPAYLCVYNLWFPGEMDGNEAFNPWYLGPYRDRFPTPKRHTQSLKELMVPPWQYIGAESLGFDLPFSLEDLVGYLSTQSNITRAIDAGQYLEEIQGWLKQELAPFFSTSTNNFRYLGKVEVGKIG